jgi:hypothetical protein
MSARFGNFTKVGNKTATIIHKDAREMQIKTQQDTTPHLLERQKIIFLVDGNQLRNQSMCNQFF